MNNESNTGCGFMVLLMFCGIIYVIAHFIIKYW
jgi:hypothetical protein